MLSFLVHFVPLFTLALWVGGGAAIGFIAAPVAFERAGSRRVAGDWVGHMLRRFDLYVFTFGPIAGIFTLLELLGSRGGERALTLKLTLIASMLGLALYARFALGPELARLRDQLGEKLERLSEEDVQRRAFGRLHAYSLLCLFGQLVLGALALALCVMTLLPPLPHS